MTAIARAVRTVAGRRRASALLLATVVLLAGCGGIQAGPSGRASEPSVTPAPVPDGPVHAGAAPGPSLDSVTEEHLRYLSGVSYTRRVTETAVYDNGTLAGQVRVTATVGANRRRIRVTVDSTVGGADLDGRPDYELWVINDRAVSRAVTANGTRYRTRPRSAVDGAIRALTTRRFGSGGEYRRAPGRAVDTSGSVEAGAYRLPLRGTPGESRLPVGPPPANATATATVLRSGVVERFVVRYRAYWRPGGAPDGEPSVTVVERVQFDDVTTTTVSRPDWVGNVTARTDR